MSLSVKLMSRHSGLKFLFTPYVRRDSQSYPPENRFFIDIRYWMLVALSVPCSHFWCMWWIQLQ